MKRLLLVVLIVFTASTVFAAGIGVKGGYSKMYDDYSDWYDDTWNIGIYFDLGKFLFDTLQFRPGLDYLSLEPDEGDGDTDVYGIHIDWYWFFMGKKQFSPYLGFGPALNYYDFEDDSTMDEDSDAGIEGFAGVEFNLTGPWTLLVELRYLWHDIADRDTTIVKFNVGLMYYF